MPQHIDGIVLFSGGLDSVLTAMLLREQGLNVLCIHFTSPFFGDPAKVACWRKAYGLDIEAMDASEAFVRMLAQWPPHGVGKTLNPCVDCKITLLGLARQIMATKGASFIATGEVIGQRPMSQRADALNIIARDSGTRGLLLRPLCGRLLEPTDAEISGLVQREKLLGISGRGRSAQLELASRFGIKEIPSPAGGCRLTERENARRYWPILKACLTSNEKNDPDELVRDFKAANNGRLLFRQDSGECLGIGRNEADNARIAAARLERDIILKLPFPGPLAIAHAGLSWPPGHLREAAAILASYAPKSRQTGEQLNIRIIGQDRQISVEPDRHENIWTLPDWQTVRAEIQETRKRRSARTQ